MKKNIIIIVSIIVVLTLAVFGAYLIDKNRMTNNEPVIFSTWGYQYTTPEKFENENNGISNETESNKIETNNTEIDNVENNMTEINKIENIQINEKESVFIDLLDGWNYELSGDSTDRYEYAINLWKSDRNKEMTLYQYKNRFGTCGTGLKVKEVTLENGNVVEVGFYDNDERWSFVIFEDDVAMINSGLTLEESNEALNMIKTIKFVKTYPGHIVANENIL